MKKLGMIGGISWASTIDYYESINKSVNARAGGMQYPELLIYSLNYGMIQGITSRYAWDEFFDLVSGIAANLRDGGAEGLILCANTAHIVADRVEASARLPVINIVDATARAIKEKGLKTVSLLGTRFTMELDFFRVRLASHGINSVIPGGDDRAFIHSTIFGELGRGEIRDDTRRRYQDIIASLSKTGAEGAILGCTEIPLLIKAKDVDVPVFDTTAIHVAAATEFILS